jgi:hypothetical protein
VRLGDGDFDSGGIKSVRVTRWELGGPGRSYVLSCVVEMEYEDGPREQVVRFGDNPPVIATVEALMRVLNKQLAR